MNILRLVLLAHLYHLSSALFLPRVDPEVYMNISETIRNFGYPCEEHEVVTEDGYILSLQRINRGRPRQVVLLQHGIFDSAHTWLFNMPLQNLPFVLADYDFDVWLANSRGTTYSRRNVRFSVKSTEFWDFSFDEMAKYDLPATIKYALKVSGAKTLHFIGHSQGSAIGFAQFSRDNATAKLISSFTALGPVAKLNHMGLIPRMTLKSIVQFSPLINIISHGEFYLNSKLMKLIASGICSNDILTPLCSNPIFWLAGFDVSNLNSSRLPVIVGHTPAGTSLKNLAHWEQLAETGDFRMYDYGSESRNMYMYGTTTPPVYDVSQLNVPLSIYWGGKDILADPEDVLSLFPLVYKSLKYHKFMPTYNHMDYIWGIDAYRSIYEEVVDFITSHHQ